MKLAAVNDSREMKDVKRCQTGAVEGLILRVSSLYRGEEAKQSDACRLEAMLSTTMGLQSKVEHRPSCAMHYIVV